MRTYSATVRIAYRFIVLALLLASGGCGLRDTIRTPEQWYPNYSLFRIAPPKDIIVYVHGYGGSEETFGLLPYLEASASRLHLYTPTTIMYFNYKTGIDEKNVDSLGVISEDLRAFLHLNVFDRIPTIRPRTKVICHSTGCPVVLYYIANNPFDHGIDKLITVAGAHYGAYFAEPASSFKAFLGRYGDKQVSELKYGSRTLFELQARLHHLLAKAGKPDPVESDLQDTAFSPFTHVVSKDVDKKFEEAARKLAEGDKNYKWSIKLPEIASVVGTDGWNASKARQYSDGVIRVESALLDCRLLAKAPPEISDLNKLASGDLEESRTVWNPECKDKLILFLPCSHTKLFEDKNVCQDAIIALIDYFLQTEGSQRNQTTDEDLARLASAYRSAVGDDLKPYLRHMNMGALWVNVSYGGLEGSGNPADVQTFARAVATINAHIKSVDRDGCKGEPKYVDHSPFAFFLLESDFIQAVRDSRFNPERLFYFKYLEAPQELCLEVDAGGKPRDIRQIPQKITAKQMKIRMTRGQTTMVSCRRQSPDSEPVDCEITTETAPRTAN